MWKRDKGLALSALSALLALGCGGEAVDVGHNGGSRWADAATSTDAAAEPQTVYESQAPEVMLGFTLDGPTLYALVSTKQSIELTTCPLARCRSERTTLFSRPKAMDDGNLQLRPLVLAAGRLYWVDNSSQQRRVLACPTAGCSESQLVTQDSSEGLALAADDEAVFWVDFERRLMRRAHDAEAPALVRDLTDEGQLGSRLMAHGDHIYFLANAFDDSPTIRRVLKDGTSAPELVVIDRQIGGFGFANDSLLYLSQILTGRVATCSLDGCESGGSTLAANQRWPSALRVEGNEVFWLNSAEWSNFTSKATLLSCLLPDCAAPQTRTIELPFVPEANKEDSFAVNQESIVWLEGNHSYGTHLRRVAR